MALPAGQLATDLTNGPELPSIPLLFSVYTQIPATMQKIFWKIQPINEVIHISRKYCQSSPVRALRHIVADLFFPIKVKWDADYNKSDSYQRFAGPLDSSCYQKYDCAEDKKYWY
jgi:hypothetical protein